MKNAASTTPSMLGVFVLVAVLLGMSIAMNFQKGDLTANHSVKNAKDTNTHVMKKVGSEAGKSLIEQQKKKLLDKVNLQYIYPKRFN